jgi:hypothetical protein
MAVSNLDRSLRPPRGVLARRWFSRAGCDLEHARCHGENQEHGAARKREAMQESFLCAADGDV